MERLQNELFEAKPEVQRQRELMSLGVPTIHKEFSLVAQIRKWSGQESTVTLEEFLSSIESSVRLGKWEDADRVEIAVSKLTVSAKTFFQGCAELHADDVTWKTFNEILRNRYKDVRTDEFHLIKLQTARQAKNEDPLQFADRCKNLEKKVVCKVDDAVAQRVQNENAERLTLTTFVTELTGISGRQVRLQTRRP
jgi:hypothetical protein